MYGGRAVDSPSPLGFDALDPSVVSAPGEGSFRFDLVFPPAADQQAVFAEVGERRRGRGWPSSQRWARGGRAGGVAVCLLEGVLCEAVFAHGSMVRGCYVLIC